MHEIDDGARVYRPDGKDISDVPLYSIHQRLSRSIWAEAEAGQGMHSLPQRLGLAVEEARCMRDGAARHADLVRTQDPSAVGLMCGATTDCPRCRWLSSIMWACSNPTFRRALNRLDIANDA